MDIKSLDSIISIRQTSDMERGGFDYHISIFMCYRGREVYLSVSDHLPDKIDVLYAQNKGVIQFPFDGTEVWSVESGLK